jgi:Ca2+-binding EF-hand superfamily protein
MKAFLFRVCFLLQKLKINEENKKNFKYVFELFDRNENESIDANDIGLFLLESNKRTVMM